MLYLIRLHHFSASVTETELVSTSDTMIHLKYLVGIANQKKSHLVVSKGNNFSKQIMLHPVPRNISTATSVTNLSTKEPRKRSDQEIQSE